MWATSLLTGLSLIIVFCLENSPVLFL
ncbi:unnamed protein product [Spirodela intermedia]|uniref:Uncharacterized protein n=1 Tax=Spirodela intermedia TaxID=51605 RepID=A0A7I8K2L8_SPIIN|nr:unnamed protein product [Spirodela intermedia]CAA7389846.1 unnamed protein product [Spirodela intermedia]